MSDEYFEVDKVLETKLVGGTRQYLLSWCGTDEKGNDYPPSWEPEANVSKDLRVQSGDKFNSEAKVDCPDKQECNIVFGQMCALYSVRGPILVLDSASLTTSKFLSQFGFSDVRVPNNVVFENVRAAVELVKLKDSIHVLDLSVGEYINTLEDPLGAIWLDYTCTFAGSKRDPECVPEKDIKALFQRKLVRHGTLLALTVCFRGFPGCKKGKKYAAIRAIWADLAKWARKGGYQLERPVEDKVYYPTMAFLVCRIVRG